jgi:hypothetical protein
MSQIVKFGTLVGLRAAEIVESVELINNNQTLQRYYNAERQCLEHFRFPETFLRRTKSAYISLADNQLLEIAQKVRKIPRYEVLRFRCVRKGLEFHMGWCRKIFGSWLRQNGIASETVDLLQGRVPRTVFARNYFTPSVDYSIKVLDALKQLQKEHLS